MPRILSATVSQVYRVTITDAKGCVGKDSVSVVVYPLPPANAGRDTMICRGSVLRIGSDSIDGHRYAWSPRTGLSDTSVAKPAASPDTMTTYYLTVTAPTGCIKRDTIIVRVKEAAQTDAGRDTSICADH